MRTVPCHFPTTHYYCLRHLRHHDFPHPGCGRWPIDFWQEESRAFFEGLSSASPHLLADPELRVLQIFLAGLALQLASFAVFTFIYLLFLYRVYKHKPSAWSQDKGMPWYKNWLSLAGALSLSCVGILVRISRP